MQRLSSTVNGEVAVDFFDRSGGKTRGVVVSLPVVSLADTGGPGTCM